MLFIKFSCTPGLLRVFVVVVIVVVVVVFNLTGCYILSGCLYLLIGLYALLFWSISMACYVN